jgi:hypothetical protein
MRNWGIVVTGFYILIVAALSPYFGLGVLENWNLTFDPSRGMDWLGVAIWSGWTLLLAGGPLVLLVTTVDPRRERLKPRRHILISAGAAGLALSLLAASVAASIVVAVLGENGKQIAVASVLAVWPGSWVVWTLLLWRKGAQFLNPATRIYRRLIAGSALELLIAVPCHAIVRARHDCCAPAFTAMSIATGLAILLMSIGPGVLFLFRARIHRLSLRVQSGSTQSNALQNGGCP